MRARRSSTEPRLRGLMSCFAAFANCLINGDLNCITRWHRLDHKLKYVAHGQIMAFVAAALLVGSLAAVWAARGAFWLGVW